MQGHAGRWRDRDNVTLEGSKGYTFVLSGKAGRYELIKVEDSVAEDPS
ncbi:MAG TPA: hypothetical protein VMY76_04800 [Gemmatimonadales bacterium]|nr:hypothetical protein [Gemmatimonadales bacterium]